MSDKVLKIKVNVEGVAEIRDRLALIEQLCAEIEATEVKVAVVKDEST